MMIYYGVWCSLCQVFCDGLSRELCTSEEIIDGLFPRLRDLLDVHLTFLDRLLCTQALTTDRSIDNVGTLLIQQVNY